MFNFLRNCQTVFQCVCTPYVSSKAHSHPLSKQWKSVHKEKVEEIDFGYTTLFAKEIGWILNTERYRNKNRKVHLRDRTDSTKGSNI